MLASWPLLSLLALSSYLAFLIVATAIMILLTLYPPQSALCSPWASPVPIPPILLYRYYYIDNITSIIIIRHIGLRALAAAAYRVSQIRPVECLFEHVARWNLRQEVNTSPCLQTQTANRKLMSKITIRSAITCKKRMMSFCTRSVAVAVRAMMGTLGNVRFRDERLL